MGDKHEFETSRLSNTLSRWRRPRLVSRLLHLDVPLLEYLFSFWLRYRYRNHVGWVRKLAGWYNDNCYRVCSVYNTFAIATSCKSSLSRLSSPIHALLFVSIIYIVLVLFSFPSASSKRRARIQEQIGVGLQVCVEVAQAGRGASYSPGRCSVLPDQLSSKFLILSVPLRALKSSSLSLFRFCFSSIP